MSSLLSTEQLHKLLGTIHDAALEAGRSGPRALPSKRTSALMDACTNDRQD
jgi:hypothetical protein